MSALHQEALPGFFLIRTDEIDEGERLRPVDQVWADALAHMMAQDGQKKTIEVSRLPGSKRWIVVDGAHRLAAAKQIGLVYLRAEVVSDAQEERRLREIMAQLGHKGLTNPFDRAVFSAELVQIKRAKADSAEASHRAASVHTHLKRAIAADAAEAMETISHVYGWSEEVGEELGLTGRTIRNDLFLYRSLAPSLIERLRAGRHSAAGNASQLRALAKRPANEHGEIVNALLGEGGWEPCKTVAEAIRRVVPGSARTTNADNKLLSTFTSTFRRMSLTEKKGALAQLAKELPAGFSIVEGEQRPAKAAFPAEHQRYRDEALERIDDIRELIDGLEEDEAIPGDRGALLYEAGRKLRGVRFTIAGNGFELGGGEPSPAHPDAEAAQADVAAPAMHFIAEQLGQDVDPTFIIGELKQRFGARARFANGTNELLIGKLYATSTAGGLNLLRAWVRRAQKAGVA